MPGVPDPLFWILLSLATDPSEDPIISLPLEAMPEMTAIA
jgi:hypothetical protein